MCSRFRLIALKTLVALMSLLLLGCTQDRGEAALDNYFERLSNVLEGLVTGGVQELDGYQDRLQREQRSNAFSRLNHSVIAPLEAESLQIDLLDFMSLYGCRVQEVIALSNASLGKVAVASQKVLSDLRFLELAPECVEQLRKEDKATLAEQLELATDYKQRHLERALALAIFSGDEYKAFWKPPRPLGDYPDQLSNAPVAALQQLIQMRAAWIGGRVTEDRSRFESSLFELSKGDGGALLNAFTVLEHGVKRAQSVIDHAFSSQKICEARPAYSRDVLANVVQKFFVGDVQQWAALLNKRHFELNAAVQSLEDAFHAQLSSEYLSWAARRDGQVERVKGRIQNHVKTLQILLNPDQLAEWCKQR